MTFLEKFIIHLRHFSFIQKNERQLLAVSGGVDSVVLCHLMQEAGYDFVIAHCNFQLRGEESESDEQFVRQLGKQYDKAVLVNRFGTEKYAVENKLSIQVAARELRYNWFREIIAGSNSKENAKPEQEQDVSSRTFDRNKTIEQQTRKQQITENPITPNPKPQTNNIEQQEADNEQQETRNGFNEQQEKRNNNSYILTAHHADDNIETVVMNFFRGTGLKGLTGMDDEFRKIFRPLLPFRKKEILAYAKENNLAFAEDSSNANSYYTRNYFRNDLLPAVKKVFPQAEENMLKNIDRFSEAAKIYEEAIRLYKKKLVQLKGNEEHIAILKLQKQVAYKTLLWEIIKERSFTAAQTDEAIKLFTAGNGSYIESCTHRIIRNRSWLIIAPLQQPLANSFLAINDYDSKVTFAAGEIVLQPGISLQYFTIPNAKNIAAIDAGSITFPLLLRRWKQGDYFYPLGMQKKKKISRFLIDQKLSPVEKENVWVIESGKRIVWIVNQRIDDRFKIREATKTMLKLIFNQLK